METSDENMDGRGAKDAIPDLERLMEKDPDESVRQRATEAAERIQKHPLRGMTKP